MNKQLMLTLFSITLVVLFIGSVVAVTASIGNARMILRAQVGDTIQKTILVKNINNESVNIEITASGDLAKDIKILDNNFTLKVGEEKDARFTIKVTKNGAFENKIIVKFFSVSEGKGVVLSSSVIVMVNDENSIEGNDTNPDNPDNPSDNVNDRESNPLVLLLTVTGIVLLIFFALLIVYYFRANKKNSEEVSEETLVDSEEDLEEEIDNSEEEKVGKKTKPKKRTRKK